MTLQQYIETEIIPRYNNFDKAHNITHVEAVIERSLRLARQYGADEQMAYAIAAYHDLGLVEGREYHHIASGRIVANDSVLKLWFSPEQIIIMKEAVEDHRASAQEAPRSLYGKIVAEADRLIDPETTLRRTVQYGLKHLAGTNDRETHYHRFKEHLQEKYARGGYLKLWLPESDNAAGLECLRTVIADETQLRATFDRIFDEESK